MKRVYIGMMLLTAGLLSGCSVGDEDGDYSYLDRNLNAYADNAMYGTFTGEWSMLDKEGKKVTPEQDINVTTLSEKVTVKVEDALGEDYRRITVSKMPVWFINTWKDNMSKANNGVEFSDKSFETHLYNVISSDPMRNAPYDYSNAFLGELGGASSGKYVYDLSLVSSFVFVCDDLLSSLSYNQNIRVECTFMKNSQALYNGDYDTIDLYLPIDFVKMDNSVDRLEIPMNGDITLVLHAERVRQ